MLSIIVSSYQPEYFKELEKSILDTCGIEYEIIKVDNPNLIGICKAYNLGALKAEYEYFLFIHEDVVFHTKNWGKKLIKYLEDKRNGVVGVAGSTYVPFVPSSWWVAERYARMHLIQSDKKNVSQNISQNIFKKNFSKNNLSEKVFSLDGVFLSCRKEIHQKYKFNEKLNGFHAYDIDFSIRIANDFINLVTGEILIEHFSLGNPDKKWFNETIKSRKYFKVPKSQIINKKTEFKSFKLFEKQMKDFNLSFNKIIILYIKYFNFRKLGIKNVLKIILKK